MNPEVFLEKIAAPRHGKDQLYQLGQIVSSRVASALAHLPHWLDASGTVRKANSEIANHSDSNERPRDPLNPALGFVGDRPVWAILLVKSGLTGPLGGDSIRALVLLDILWDSESTPSNQKSFFSDLHPVVKRFDEPEFAHLAHGLEVYLKAPGKTTREQAEFFLKQVKGGEEAAKLLNKIHKTLVVRASEYQKSVQHLGRVKIRQPPVDGLGGVLESTPDTDSDDEEKDESGDDDVYDLSPPESINGGASLERAAATRSGWLILRSLRPESDVALSDLELIACWRHLESASNQADSSKRTRLLAIAIWKIVLSTSRGLRDVRRYLETALGGGSSADDDSLIWHGDVCCFRVRPPGIGTRRKPAQMKPDNPWTANEIDLPLADSIQADLQMLRLGRSDHPIPMPQALNPELDTLVTELKAITPRFSEGRARLGLPVHAFGQTGDPAMVMTLFGDTFGASDAPLAYYSSSRTTLRRSWSSLHNDVFRTTVAALPIAEGVPDQIGAPLAATPEESIKSYIELVKTQCRSKMQTGTALQKHDALTIYLARMWLAATSHRGFESLGTLLIGDVDPIGLACMQDKPADQNPGVRPTIIVDLLIKQITVILVLRRDIQSNNQAPLLEIDGKPIDLTSAEAPLFWLLESGRTIKSSDLDLEAETGLPRNVFRSRVSMQLRAANISPRLIFFQLGHIWNGQTPVGPESLDSVETTRDLLAPAVSSILANDGWSLIGGSSIKGISPENVWPVPDSRIDYEYAWRDDLKKYRDNHQDRLTEKRRFTGTRQSEHQRWVDEALAHVAPSYSPDHPPPVDVVIEAHHVEYWLNSAVETFKDVHRVASCLQSLRQRIIKFRKKFKWTGEKPPQAFGRPIRLPTVGALHIRAARLNRQLRDAASDPATLKQGREVIDRWARLAVLLITEHRIRDLSQLMQILAPIASGTSPPELAMSAGFLELQCNGRGRTHSLSQSTSILTRSLMGQPAPTLLQLQTRVRRIWREVFGHSPMHVLEKILSLARMASRIEVAGVAWASTDRMDPGTLSFERSSEFIQNAIGASFRPDPGERGGVMTGTELPAIGFRNTALLPQQYATYRQLRRSLWQLREPGAAQQGVKDKRFEKATTLLSAAISSETTSSLVSMLARQAYVHLAGKERTRIKTAYGHMVSIGRRLILAVGDRDITLLNALELEQIYLLVITRTPKISRANVAQELISFQTRNEGLLADADMSEVLQVSYLPIANPRVEVVTEAEYAACLDAFRTLAITGHLSHLECLQRQVTLILLFRLGCRAGEITHLLAKDIFCIEGKWRLLRRASSLGLLKTVNAAGLLKLSEHLSRSELASVLRLKRLSIRQQGTHHATSQPLISVPSNHDLGLLLSDIRTALACAGGAPSVSLHALRHTEISRRLWLLGHENADASGAHTNSYIRHIASAAHCGHAEVGTGHTFYWHLDHLKAPLQFERLGHIHLSILTGTPPNTLAQAKRRAEKKSIGSKARYLRRRHKNGGQPKFTPPAVSDDSIVGLIASKIRRQGNLVEAGVRFVAYILLGLSPREARFRCRLRALQTIGLVRGLCELPLVTRVSIFSATQIEQMREIDFYEPPTLSVRTLSIKPSRRALQKIIDNLPEIELSPSESFMILSAASRNFEDLIPAEARTLNHFSGEGKSALARSTLALCASVNLAISLNQDSQQPLPGAPSNISVAEN